MALTLTCDGCACTLPIDTKPVGRLAPAFYCPTCTEVWETHVMAEDRKREAIIAAFEAWRREALGEARKKLMRLPDE